MNVIGSPSSRGLREQAPKNAEGILAKAKEGEEVLPKSVPGI